MHLFRASVACALLITGVSGAAPAQGAITRYEKDSFDAQFRLSSLRTGGTRFVAGFLPAILRGDGGRVSTRVEPVYTLVRYTHERKNALPDAVVALDSGDFKSLADARRQFSGFHTTKRTRLRGHAALLFRSLGRPDNTLVWKEAGKVRALGSGTPKTVSLATLRKIAAGLETVERSYNGGIQGEDAHVNNVSASFAVTDKAVSVLLGWGASCPLPDGSQDVHSSGGELGAIQIPRRGNTFSAENLSQLDPAATDPWMTRFSGVIRPDRLDLTFRATLDMPGVSCDSGTITGALTGRGD